MSYGVRLNVVRTNWQKPFSVKWGMTHVLGIAAVLHLFHRQFGSGVIADDVAYDTQVTPWSSNAITNQMLGCGGFPIRTTGAAWSRTEKAGAVAANPVVLKHLRVCYERPELGGNCGECEKCIRTKLNFYAVGIPLGAGAWAASYRRRCQSDDPAARGFLYSIADVLSVWHVAGRRSDPSRGDRAGAPVQGGNSRMERSRCAGGETNISATRQEEEHGV